MYMTMVRGIMVIGRMIVHRAVAISMVGLVRHVRRDITVHRGQTVHRHVQMHRQIRTMSAVAVPRIHVRGIVMPGIMGLRPPAVHRARRAVRVITVPVAPAVPRVLVSLIMPEPAQIASRSLL